MNFVLEVTENPRISTDQEFRERAEAIAQYYARFGVRVTPYHDPKLPHFSALSWAKKQAALAYLRRIWEITCHHIANGVDAGNNEVALWSALKACALTPASDLFSHLEADDKIEIYTLDGIQIWRNCNVMKICSYTLEEIYSFDWQERYERLAADNHAILTAIGEMLAPGSNRHVAAMIPYHEVAERFSELRYRLQVRHDHFFSLVAADGNPAAFLVTSKVEILAKGISRDRQERAAPRPHLFPLLG